VEVAIAVSAQSLDFRVQVGIGLPAIEEGERVFEAARRT